ncbi:PspA/IM30 family protein [Dietzia massiliensis]|uniref:PspA/IM30 family protein n=1 Tax=Dietzia massiliensis TaxID=2697499 RepID=UPI001BCB09D5|nr:PspA/IM30 family protein [Dietzia massiliensis]MBS7549342.1 PspA/IM30 family protein [Dietzia massiliensis]MBS7549349.1 PspA/IM30 family protein [Dietzia massiliensis]
MPNPFAKGWNYLKASLDKTVDDNADPKVLVHQAMNNARQQHKSVSDQAAAVIGNAKQLEIAMGTKARQLDEVQGQIRQTLQVAEQARAEGDTARAQQFDAQAEQLAGRLVALEQDLENTRQLHGQAVQAAEQAKQAVKESEHRLRETLAQEDQLLLQATQAEMQHRSTESMASLQGAGGGNSPTFDEIRAKIEGRYTTALGKQELAEATGAPSTAQLDAAAFTRESEGKSKLEQIRASMGLSSGSDAGADRQLTDGGEQAGASGQQAGQASQAEPAGAPEQADPEAPRNPDEATDQPGPEDLSGPTLPRDTRE